MPQPELYSSDWYQQQKLGFSTPNDDREQPRSYHLLNTIQKVGIYKSNSVWLMVWITLDVYHISVYLRISLYTLNLLYVVQKHVLFTEQKK